jgi:hypothetical protein
MRGTIVEADILNPQATKDTVTIDQAQLSNNEVRARGLVSRTPGGQYGVNVSLFIGTATGGRARAPGWPRRRSTRPTAPKAGLTRVGRDSSVAGRGLDVVLPPDRARPSARCSGSLLTAKSEEQRHAGG